jgi:hypothetical protein
VNGEVCKDVEVNQREAVNRLPLKYAGLTLDIR